MKITFTDKTSIDNRPDLSDIEKVTGGNINEIKKVVNANADELDTIKTSVEGFSTEIKTLKENDIKQDEKIKYLEEEAIRLRQDIQASQLTGEANGESIDLNDSSNARFNKFEIGGNHSQETREGYNILDLSKKPYNEQASSLNGATVTQKNGILTIDATSATDLVTIKSVWTSYTNSTNIKMPKGNYYTPLILNISKAESGESVGQKTGNITLEEDCVCAQWFYNVGKGQKIELPLFISNNQNKRTYEQYGATPSLDFPSEIKAVKDNANVVVCNKNLLKITAESVSNWNGLNITILDDKRIKINGTVQGSVDTYDFSLNNYKDVSNLFTLFENSVLSLNLCGGKITNQQYFSVSVVKQNVDGTKTHLQVIPSSHKLLVAGKYYWFRLFLNKGTIFENAIIEIQIEKGSTSTDYEAHQEQTITMPVQQEMLKEDYFDFENEKQSNLFEKIILDGVNKKCTTSKAVGDGSEFQWAFTIAQATSYIRKVYSNIAKQASDFNQINGIKISANSNIAYVRSEMKALNGKEATVENVNELLKNMYDNGNPAIFYIEKASNKELDFTDEQKAVAKKIKETLHTYKNITHIYSTDETSPIMNVEYAKDLNTTISNIQALVINNASEEVNG